MSNSVCVPIVDDADLDELVDRVAEQAGRDEDEGDPGPAEEGREVEPARAVVEADAEQRPRWRGRSPRREDPDRATVGRGGRCLAGQEERRSRRPRG